MYGKQRGLNALVLLVALVFLAGCSNTSKLAIAGKKSGGLWGMRPTSAAFADEGAIPTKYTADGQNVSPPLKWNAGPSGTKEYVIIVEDPDASGDMPAVHWIVYGIPANTTSLPEGGGSQFKQGKNFKGGIGYTGPAPEPGKRHRYFFQIFALSEPLNVATDASRQELANALEGWVLSKGQLIGTYERSR